jgi:hypothetical protein
MKCRSPCEVQARYHSIAGCLAGKKTPAPLAAELNLGYSTVISEKTHLVLQHD